MLLKRFLEDKFNKLQPAADKIEDILVAAKYGPGDIFYVDATNGSNSYIGTDPKHPFATLNYAVSKCEANKGDVILMMPWHAETIEDTGTASGATTDECVFDKAGIKVLGLGWGLLKPTFTLEGATDAALVIVAGATNVMLKNFIIKSNLANVAAGITLSATSDGAVLEDLVLRDGNDDEKELVLGVSVAADCDDIKIRRCIFSTVPSGGCANAILLAGGSDRCEIVGNIAQGTYSAGIMLASAAASTEMIITGNVFTNQGALALGLNASCTGILARNFLAGTTSIAAALTGCDAMWPSENYVTGEDNKSGLLDPGADADA